MVYNKYMTKEFLSKRATGALHGVAILMMIYHHVFINGKLRFVNNGISVFDLFDCINFGIAPTFQMTFAYFCKICVAIFAFTSGYAIYRQLEKQNSLSIKDMYLYCFKRLWSFYKKYFLCCIVFITLEYIYTGDSFFDFSFENILLNLIGLRSSFNSTWWYVSVYYLMVLVSPLVFVILKKFNIKEYLICIGLFILSIVISLFSGNMMTYIKGISFCLQFYVITYLIIFMEGMFCARYKLMESIAKYLNAFTALILLVLVFIARAALIRVSSESLFDLALTLPFVVGFTVLVSKTKYLEDVLVFLGKYSSYIWYVHAYFYAYLFFGWVIKSDVMIIVYTQICLYSLACSFIFDKIERLIFQRKTV